MNCEPPVVVPYPEMMCPCMACGRPSRTVLCRRCTSGQDRPRPDRRRNGEVYRQDIDGVDRGE